MCQDISKPKVGKDISAYSWQELVQMANDPETVEQIGYLIGQSRPVNISGYGSINFQLIGIQQDDLTDGGKAAMTFMAVSIITIKQMNSSDTTSGGWGASAMREWMNSTLYNAFPNYLKDSIKQVKKKYRNNYGGSVATIDDYLWLISEKELTGSTIYGDEGEFYEYWTANNNNTARIKFDAAVKADAWWLRSLVNSTGFRSVNYSGVVGGSRSDNTDGVVPCFCIG